MTKKICDFCNKTFIVHPYREKTAHFCSWKCYHSYQKRLAYQPKICPFCGKKFIPSRNTRQNKFCSMRCSILGRRKYKNNNEKYNQRIYSWRGEKICAYCGRKFKYTSKQIHQKYCSVLCNVKSRAYKINENFFNKINSGKKAYLLGLIFSDGSISTKGHQINISSKDQELIKTCKEILKTDKPIYHYQNYYALVISSQRFHNSLKKHGVLTRKSWKEYGLPTLSKLLMWHFIRGIFDGDGSFYIDDRSKWKYLCASFSCGSQRFLQEIKEWLKKQNIKTQNIRFDRKPNDKGSWQLRISRKEAIKKFTTYLYKNNNNCYLERKYKIVKNFYG